MNPATLALIALAACFVAVVALAPYWAYGGFHWTPYRVVLWNRAKRLLLPTRTATTRWLYGDKWVYLSDDRKSQTPEIVYHENLKGHYIPPLPLLPGDNVLDLGAHVGGFTIPLALANPGVRFICIEPNPDNYANLKANIIRNGVRNVHPIHAGIWGTPGPLRTKHYRHNTGGSHSRPDADGPITAHAITLETIRAVYDLQHIRLLKMDVEGAEFDCIHDADDLQGVESALVELHGGNGNVDHLAAIITKAVPHTRIQMLPGDGRQPFVLENGKPWSPTDLDGKPRPRGTHA